MAVCRFGIGKRVNTGEILIFEELNFYKLWIKVHVTANPIEHFSNVCTSSREGIGKSILQ
ncbi:hypothetical protein BH20ACI2_BH20ACI2_17740 [soil metagenome]